MIAALKEYLIKPAVYGLIAGHAIAGTLMVLVDLNEFSL